MQTASILAAGTSYHAGFASKKMLKNWRIHQLNLEFHLSGATVCHFSKKPLFFFISQSGETADSRQVLVKANEMGIPSLTVTNVPGSTLSRKPTIPCSSRRTWNCRGINQSLYSANRCPCLPCKKQSEKPMEMPSTSLWPGSWVVNRSSVYRINSFWKKPLILKFVTFETTRNAFTSDVVKITLAMEASLKLKRDFLHPVWRFCGRRTQARNHCLDWRGNSCLGPLVRSSSLPTILWKYPRGRSPWCQGSHYCRRKCC